MAQFHFPQLQSFRYYDSVVFNLYRIVTRRAVQLRAYFKQDLQLQKNLASAI